VDSQRCTSRSSPTAGTGDRATKLPQFLIVGAMKSATTTLWETIRQHPQIFMPTLKEPHFFVQPEYLDLLSKESKELLKKSTPANFDEYVALFAASMAHQLCGEASASYFLLPELSIPRIRATLGDIRIVISLRNPYERAWSEFKMHHRDQLLPDPGAYFTRRAHEALRGDSSTAALYISQSLYSARVEAFLSSFSRVHIVVVDDLLKEPRASLQSLYAFLGVDPAVGFDRLLYKNESVGIPMVSSTVLCALNVIKPLARALLTASLGEQRWPIVRTKIYRQLRKKPRMPESARVALRGLFQPDIARLESLLQRELSSWS